MQLYIYHTPAGKEPFTDWLESLRDRETQMRIRQRLRRLSLGQMGDHKVLGDGIYELRLFFGPGYRLYFAKEKQAVILLLCGGDKSSQTQDIKKARAYWQEHKGKDS